MWEEPDILCPPVSAPPGCGGGASDLRIFRIDLRSSGSGQRASAVFLLKDPESSWICSPPRPACILCAGSSPPPSDTGGCSSQNSSNGSGSDVLKLYCSAQDGYDRGGVFWSSRKRRAATPWMSCTTLWRRCWEWRRRARASGATDWYEAGPAALKP